MKTKIIEIRENEYKGEIYKIIDFLWIGDEPRFTYMSPKYYSDWCKKIGVAQLNKGMLIDVFESSNKRNFKIVGITKNE